MAQKEIHKELATELFNLTWDLIDQEEKHQAEIDRMIHADHSPRFTAISPEQANRLATP